MEFHAPADILSDEAYEYCECGYRIYYDGLDDPWDDPGEWRHMATVIRSQPKEEKKKGVRKLERVVKEKTTVDLPTALTKPSSDLDDFSFLIHGEKKIGKTTFSLQNDAGKPSLLLQFDPPQRAYERMELVCNTWEVFMSALRKLEKLTKWPYGRVVVDNVGEAYQRCMKHVCESRGVEHPEEEGWSKGWQALRQEFTQAVDRLLRLPVGVMFLAHSQWKDTETRDGDQVSRLVPRLAGIADDVISAKVDGIIAYDYAGRKRVLVLQGDDHVSAGHRLHLESYPHFIGPEGEPLRTVRAGSSPEEAYRNFRDAFNNKYVPPKAVAKKFKLKK